MKFYKCNKCGQILTVFEPKCPGITCCGESVSELVPNTADAAREKHVMRTWARMPTLKKLNYHELHDN